MRCLLAQVDVATKTFVTTIVPLDSALAESIAAAGALADETAVRILGPDIVAGAVRADRTLLVRALQALVETGVKFTSRGGEVHVSSAVESAAVVVRITGHGRTVPAASVARFFDVFGAAEVARAAGDTGLRPARRGSHPLALRRHRGGGGPRTTRPPADGAAAAGVGGRLTRALSAIDFGFVSTVASRSSARCGTHLAGRGGTVAAAPTRPFA